MLGGRGSSRRLPKKWPQMSVSASRRTSASVPIYKPDWPVVRLLAAHVSYALKRYARGTVLDVGCGAKPYAAVASNVDRWVGFDVPENTSAELHGTATNLPVGDQTVDTVLCTQVLEHVTAPEVVVHELYRALRAGGVLVLTAPQYWAMHEKPNDYFRFTYFGLVYLLETAGFEVIEVLREGTSVQIMGLALNFAVGEIGSRLPFYRSLWFNILKAPIYLVSNVLFFLVSKVLKNDDDVSNYTLVAKRPNEARQRVISVSEIRPA